MSTTSATTSSRNAGAVLFGQTRRRVLALLLGHADEAFYLRQIVRQTQAAHGAVQRELGALAGAGILLRTVAGRQVYFQANRASPIFAELRSLLLKTAGAVDVLRGALTPLAAGITAAFIFGSAARGELSRDSDIDVLVVGDVPFEAVVQALIPLQEQIGRDVNPIVYPPAEFRAKIRAGHHFLRSVLREPQVFVIGGPDELGELGAKRLADSPPQQPARDPGPARRRGPRSRRQRH